MKRLIEVGLAFILIAAGVVMASAADTTLFNFGDFLHNMRAGYGVDQHGQVSTVFYTAVYDFHTTAGISMVTLNVGYEGTLKRPTVMMGVRADNLIPLVWSGEWGQAHVSTAKLPTFECGPWISVWPNDVSNLWNLDVRYGVGAAVGF